MTKWVRALLSGKYKQGKGYLVQFDSKLKPKHCCLGVLCEVYNQEMKRQKKKTLQVKCNQKFDPLCQYGYRLLDKEAVGLPKKVREWAKVKSKIGLSRKYNFCLADLNDDGKKFKTIAQVIKNNYQHI